MTTIPLPIGSVCAEFRDEVLGAIANEVHVPYAPRCEAPPGYCYEQARLEALAVPFAHDVAGELLEEELDELRVYEDLADEERGA